MLDYWNISLYLPPYSLDIYRFPLKANYYPSP